MTIDVNNKNILVPIRKKKLINNNKFNGVRIITNGPKIKKIKLRKQRRI